jgi:hypothetical protein
MLNQPLRGQAPDLYAIFRRTVATMDEAPECEVTMNIGYATTDAILAEAADIAPTDIKNVLHRLGCAHYLLDRVYDLCCDEEGGEELVRQMSKLIHGAAEGLRMLHQIDARETRLNYYMPRLGDVAN